MADCVRQQSRKFILLLGETWVCAARRVMLKSVVSLGLHFLRDKDAPEQAHPRSLHGQP